MLAIVEVIALETIIGVFDPRNVEDALQTLYSNGIDKSQVRVVDRKRSSESTSLTNLVVGLGTMFAGVVNQATGPSAVADDVTKVGPDLRDLDIADATGFYARSLESGSTIVIVKANEEQAGIVRQLMHSAHASNVTEPPASV